jgi:hypothetical protein
LLALLKSFAGLSSQRRVRSAAAAASQLASSLHAACSLSFVKSSQVNTFTEKNNSQDAAWAEGSELHTSQQHTALRSTRNSWCTHKAAQDQTKQLAMTTARAPKPALQQTPQGGTPLNKPLKHRWLPTAAALNNDQLYTTSAAAWWDQNEMRWAAAQ